MLTEMQRFMDSGFRVSISPTSKGLRFFFVHQKTKARHKMLVNERIAEYELVDKLRKFYARVMR